MIKIHIMPFTERTYVWDEVRIEYYRGYYGFAIDQLLCGNSRFISNAELSESCDCALMRFILFDIDIEAICRLQGLLKS
jgi:hypothetical protein